MIRMSRLIIRFVVLVGMLGINFVCQAQPGDPETNPDVPISGIEILIGLGGLWGARKYAQLKKKKNSE